MFLYFRRSFWGASAALALVIAAQAQRVITQNIAIDDPRPLAKAAEVLMDRYGVPISYEDVSTYAYSPELEDAIEFLKDNPSAKNIPPKKQTLSFAVQPLGGANFTQPADKASVSSFLQTVIDQHAANGNAGQFKKMETPVGLAIVPTAARNSLGNFVPDQSPLDLRISFPQHDKNTTTFEAFGAALSAACGKQVMVDNLWEPTPSVQANNEVARDVLVKMLLALGPPPMGLQSADSKVTALTWVLGTEPGIDASHPTIYHLRFKPVVMKIEDSKGNIVRTRPITR